MQEVKTDKVPGAIGPYSQASIAGGFVFTSGQIPVNPGTGEIPAGISAQTKQVFENIKNVLSAAGTSMENVVKTTVFIKNMADFQAVNEVYASYFTAPYPARACVEVSRLPKDVLLEVEAIAEV